ncbi:hypothetical protein [Streptococcus anginosus]|uniref:hypothetical protein n=1 Tax=Streptococcus anginosus TaxID=1328 RepID=UPI0022E1AE60|nr:hypothetical protein [Streptococcus anginosus]
MATKQSKEVKIQREVEKWLTSYDMEFVTQNESVNPEIDKALSKAPSKTGGEGANLVDVKLLLKDSKLDYYPIMIELKWGSNKLEKLDKEEHVANTKTSGKEKGEPKGEYGLFTTQITVSPAGKLGKNVNFKILEETII